MASARSDWPECSLRNPPKPPRRRPTRWTLNNLISPGRPNIVSSFSCREEFHKWMLSSTNPCFNNGMASPSPVLPQSEENCRAGFPFLMCVLEARFHFQGSMATVVAGFPNSSHTWQARATGWPSSMASRQTIKITAPPPIMSPLEANSPAVHRSDRGFNTGWGTFEPEHARLRGGARPKGGSPQWGRGVGQRLPASRSPVL